MRKINPSESAKIRVIQVEKNVAKQQNSSVPDNLDTEFILDADFNQISLMDADLNKISRNLSRTCFGMAQMFLN